MSRTETNEAMAVPFNQILVNEEINSRTNIKEIKELAESIKENGLLSALLVTNGGTDKHPYTLVAGFRRAAALKELGWGSKPVNVIVVSGDGANANLIENVPRRDLHPFDLAQRIHDMVEGEYAVPEGREARKWDKKEIAAAIGISVTSINNYIRTLDGITGEVRKLLRSKDVPFRFLIKLMGLTKKEKTDDGKTVEVPDDKAQLAAAKDWIKEQEALALAGRKKKARKPKGETEGGGSGKATGKQLGEVLAIYTWQLETGQVKGKDAEVVTAQVDVLRFVTGDLKRAPGINADVRKAYEAYLAEQEAEEEGDDEEESGEE